jgi:tetratricopeptide (TPR) repeat protein
MDQFDSQQNELSLTQLLGHYAESLKILATESELSSSQVLKVLRSRDRVQDALSQAAQIEDEHLAKLVELDLELKEQSDSIGHAEHLDQLRQSLQPPESAWWWYLEPSTDSPRSKPLSAKFDWLWNVGTVACLVLATSFMTQTAKAFSTEGFDFLGTLSTIGQGAGLAFVAGGALTDQGRKAVSRSLSSIKVPPSLHAEATFAASLMLLGTAYSINQNLPLVGSWYFAQGQQHEEQGEWSQAFKAYKRALNFAPDDYKTQIALGFLHEKLGNFEQAIDEYRKGTVYGIPEFLNAQARAMLMGTLQKNSWQGGIDKQIIREAETLLERAEQYTKDFSGREALNAEETNSRLKVDIKINRTIAMLADIESNQKLNKPIQEKLELPISYLIDLKYDIDQSKSKKSSDFTTVSTAGDIRGECYHQQAYRIADEVAPSRIYGVDFVLSSADLFYACYPIFSGLSVSTLTDSAFLRSYKVPGQTGLSAVGAFPGERSMASGNISALMDIIYYYGSSEDFSFDSQKNVDKVILVKEPKRWLELSKKLSNLIERNYTPVSSTEFASETQQKVVWRFILSGSGQILDYFAYDPESLSVGQTQSFIAEALEKNPLKQLGAELEAGKPLEFADFKVVLSPQGKVLHLLPWSAAYPAWNERCREKCRNLFLNSQVIAAFKGYTPDLSNTAELGALGAALTARISSVGISSKGGWSYEEPSIFKLKVSSDGQIVEYKAMNTIASQKFGSDSPFTEDLKSLSFPELQKAPYADFKLEMRGIATRLTPWSSPK